MAQSGKARPPKSTVVSRELAELRRRHNEELARQRDRDSAIAAALRPFATARAAITDAEERLAGQLEALDERKQAARKNTDQAIQRHRQRMATAATAIKQAGKTPMETATLLGMTGPELQKLLSTVDTTGEPTDKIDATPSVPVADSGVPARAKAPEPEPDPDGLSGVSRRPGPP